MRRSRLAFGFAVVSFVACGSRTALLITDPVDAGTDSGPDVRDAGRDRRDVIDEDNALPPIDVTKPDVPKPNDCPDAEGTLVYLISQGNMLMSFYPPTSSFKTIGKIACPNVGGETPFSMAVDRKGAAYVVFTHGALFKVSTLTAACIPTAFKAMPMTGFDTFGMGFAGDNISEELYVAGTGTGGPSAGLASINTTNFQFKFIGTFKPDLDRTELTGTGDGRLFGWSPNSQSSGSTLTQIDRKTAQLIGANQLKVGGTQIAFAFAFWGGDFYIFTGVNGTTVTKYDPVTQNESNVASTSELIVGAGVSTCAPSQ
jgi:hypothetical protein